MRALDGTNWTKLRAAVEEAGTWLSTAPPGGDPLVEVVVTRLVALGAHSKWEVRRAVAVLAGQNQFSTFGPVLTNLAEDPNSRVRQAAEQALARRRDWASASPFEKQHEDRINATLDEVDARFGLRGRIAVRRASEQISNTFTRELTHELMRLLSPLTMSVERLAAGLQRDATSRKSLLEDTAAIERRVAHLGHVLAAAKTYSSPSMLTFSSEKLRSVIADSVAWVRDDSTRKGGRRPEIVVNAAEEIVAEVCRPRLMQALVNVLENAIDAYEGRELTKAIVIELTSVDARVEISVADAGVGMSDTRLADAGKLFATTKALGTGFGLPLAIKIVQVEHHGALKLESQEGKGTTVRILLPVRQRREDHP